MAEVDLSSLNIVELPDVVLVRVMSFLNLSDRRSLMLTCHRFLEIFRHPSLWYRLIINGLRTTYPHDKEELDAYRQMIDAVGHCCQELEFRFKGTFEKMDDEVRDFILNLSEKCRLETLVVSIEFANLKHKPAGNFVGPALKEDIDTLCSIVSKCHRLKSFCIRKWPVFKHTSPSHNEILEALCENPKLLKLEKLHLFWPDRNETTWASVCTNQTPEYGLKVVDHFKNLTYLSLMSYVLHEKLLDALNRPGRVRLLNLRIMVVYKSNLPLPDISDSAWSRLCSDLKVEIVFSSRVPSNQMFILLRPAVPVYKLHFMKFSRCEQQDLANIAVLYADSLEKFVDETDSAKTKALLKLAHCCTNLRGLETHGEINFADVIELAKIQGADWYFFRIPEKSIDYNMKMSEAAGDDDQVLRKNDQGEYYSVALHNWTDTDESLAQKAERRLKMIDSVTAALAYKWEPFE